MTEYLTFGNKVAALDVESTGLVSGYHEVVQLAVVLLDDNLDPHKEVVPFYMNVKPLHPERADPKSMKVNKLDLNDLKTAPEPAKVVDMLMEWVDDLELPFERCLIPMAHNYVTEYSFMTQLCGWKLRNKLLHGHSRDAMTSALWINDRHAFKGYPPPFKKVGLKDLCKFFEVENPKPHDALADSITEALVYKKMMHFDAVSLGE